MQVGLIKGIGTAIYFLTESYLDLIMLPNMERWSESTVENNIGIHVKTS